MTDNVIDVTQDDIDRGIPDDPRGCPVARALKRHYRREHDGVTYEPEVTVGDTYMAVCTADVTLRARTPLHIMRFIQRFDQHEPVNPVTFDFTWWQR